MKRISVFITIGSLVVSSFFTIVLARDQQFTAQQYEDARQYLIGVYNQLSAMDDSEWIRSFQQMADLLAEEGKMDQSEALRTMADPWLKEDVLITYKERIDNMSENGLWLILFLVAPIHMAISFASSPLAHIILIIFTSGNERLASET